MERRTGRWEEDRDRGTGAVEATGAVAGSTIITTVTMVAVRL